MDAIVTLLTTTLSATPTGVYPNGERWTNSPAYTLTAPSDNGGRFMVVVLVRTTQFRMEFKVSDPGGVIYDGEIDIANPGPTVVNIYGAPGFLTVESNNGGTWETAQAVMTDPTPEPLASGTVYVYSRQPRNTTGALVTNNSLYDFWMGRYRNGTTTAGTYYGFGIHPQGTSVTANLNYHIRTQAGSDVVAPAYIGSDNSNFGGVWLNGGKAYMLLIVDANNAPGAILTVPIDVGITGQFQVLHLADGNGNLAVRKT
jgi:hypothetical protein